MLFQPDWSKEHKIWVDVDVFWEMSDGVMFKKRKLVFSRRISALMINKKILNFTKVRTVDLFCLLNFFDDIKMRENAVSDVIKNHSTLTAENFYPLFFLKRVFFAFSQKVLWSLEFLILIDHSVEQSIPKNAKGYINCGFWGRHLLQTFLCPPWRTLAGLHSKHISGGHL